MTYGFLNKYSIINKQRSIIKAPDSYRDTTDDSLLTTRYSVLNDFTGFAIAARIACTLTVNNVSNITNAPAITNTHHCIWTRYSKSFSQLFINHQPKGNPMAAAMLTSLTKSFASRATIAEIFAPSIFPMPISFVRLAT